MEENRYQEEKSYKKYEYMQPLLLAAMLSLGLFLGFKMNDKSERFLAKIDGDKSVSIGRVEEMVRFIESRYVDSVKSDELITEAINAMLNKLDPHSIYIPPSEVNEVSENMEGSFKGLGIESLVLEDTAVITTVVKDSPAAKGGLKQFDQIVAINDTAVAGVKMNFDNIRTRLRAKKQAKIEIKRKGSANTLIKVIKLDAIAIPSADIAYIVKDNIGYIQIKQFSSNTYNEFMTNFEYLHDKKGMKNLIIDMRGNPGGYLPQATKIVNQLITEADKLIVYTEGRNDVRQDYNTNGKAFFNDIKKIAVLVDENSASGAEVIAGALQDHDRAIVIGRRTFGKGLVQEQFSLSNGGALRLTTARYFTPSGRCIQKDFSDISEYDNEIYARSLFTNSNKKDSLKSKPFKTLSKGRKVYSCIGIEPEVFIPADSSTLDKNYYLIERFASQFLIKEILTNKIEINKTVDFKSKSNDFINFIIKSEKEANIKVKYLAKASQILEENFEYIKTNGDSKAKSKMESNNDKFIKSALEYFDDKIKL